MPKKGQAIKVRANTAAIRAEKKRQIVELRSQMRTWREIAIEVDVSRRTITDWRQKDEKFALELAAADLDQRDALVQKFWEWINDESFPAHERVLSAMFTLKQLDPSFRENHKVEHVVSGGLAASLKQLAKLGRSD